MHLCAPGWVWVKEDWYCCRKAVVVGTLVKAEPLVHTRAAPSGPAQLVSQQGWMQFR